MTEQDTNVVVAPEPLPDAIIPEVVSVVEAVSDIEEVTPEVLSAAAVTTTRSKRNILIAVVILVVLAALAAGAYWYKTQNVVTLVGGVEYPEVVAVVNGEKVNVAEFQQSYDQAAAIAVQQGFDPAADEAVRAEVKSQAVTVLVNTVLMKQQAIAAGFTATDEAVTEQVAKLETQFGGKEQLATALIGAGLTESEMIKDLKNQIIVDQFIAASAEWAAVSVTDEEVRSYYDQAAAEMENVPPFEEVSEQVKAQLLQEKQLAATNVLIERVRSESKIEVKI